MVIRRPSGSIEERLALFDQVVERQREREARRPPEPLATDRGWTREELYDRGRPREPQNRYHTPSDTTG